MSRSQSLFSSFAVSFMVGIWSASLFASDASEIFQRRIAPIAKSERASSCIECHFAGVDLRQYVLEDSSKTFAALRAAGLIDVNQPSKSKLLEFISRRPAKPDELLEKVRAEEYEAFKQWIEIAAKEPYTLSAPAPKQTIGSPAPAEVIRHARIDRVLQSFVENVWVDMERCENCHSPAKNERLVKKHGEQMSWISPDDPAGTLAKSVQQGIIDLDDPEKSLILRKPLALVEHGGHRKFAVGSDPDKRFRRFLNDYAATVTGKYATASDLPVTTTEVRFSTGQQLKITGLPKEWRDRVMRVDIYRWENNQWSARRVATGDGYVNGAQQVWQNTILGVAYRSQASATDILKKRLLPDGKYLVKMYLDRDQRLDDQRDYELGEKELVGSVEFDGQWKPGYQPPKTVAFELFQYFRIAK